MQFVYNDGGRAAAGFKGEARDCVTRAIAIATGMAYLHVYATINTMAGEAVARKGVPKPVVRKVMASLGWRWVPKMKIGSGCTTHLSPEELPKGRLVVSVSRHVCAVIDGVLHDTHDCTRDGSRCVYGYFVRDGK